MIKAVLYLGLTAIAILATFINPFIGVIACIEAYLMNPTAISMDDGQFRYQLWTSVAFIISCLIYRPRPLPRVGREDWVLQCVWAFVAVGALSALWAQVSADVALTEIWEVAKIVVIVSLFVRVIRTEKQITVVMFALVAGVLHASFLHIFGTRWGYVNAALARGEGVLPDSQTGVLILFAPLIILLAMFGSRREKILCWIALPFVLDSVVNTYERTGFTALIVEFLLVFLYVPKRQKRQLIPVMVAGLGLLLVRFAPADYWERMATIANPHEEASADSRFEINDASWRMFLDHPMGVGYRNYPYTSPRYLGRGMLTKDVEGELVRSAHNSYFTVLCETGVFGFGFWIAAFGGTILMLRRIRKRVGPNMGPLEYYATGLEIGLCGWAIGGWVQSYHEVDPAYWFVGFAIVLFRLQHQRQAESADEVNALETPEPSLAG